MNISDNNLRLAILESLARQGVLEIPPIAELYTSLGLTYNEDSDQPYEPSKQIEAHWQNIWSTIDPSQLTALVWDEAPDIQQTIWPFFGGEEEYFDIHSLQGIEQLQALTSIELQFLASIDDCSPILQLPNLKQVLFNSALNDTPINRETIETLKQRDVTVDLNAGKGWSTTITAPASKPTASVPAKTSELPETHPSYEEAFNATQIPLTEFETVLRDRFTKLALALSASNPELTPATPSRVDHQGGVSDGAYDLCSTTVLTANNGSGNLIVTDGRWSDGAPAKAEVRLTLEVDDNGRSRTIKIAGYSASLPSAIDYITLKTRNVSSETIAIIEALFAQLHAAKKPS